jgi:hypothetical protein
MARKTQPTATHRPHGLEVMLMIGEDQSNGHARVDQEVGLFTSGRHHEGRERPRR